MAESEVKCPVCGRELCWLDEVYKKEDTRAVAGCSRCLSGVQAYDWAQEVCGCGGIVYE